MGRLGSGAAAALVVCALWAAARPVHAGPAVVAQAETPATPAAPVVATPGESSPVAGAPAAAPAMKAALSVPACSLRYLEAKVAGKLQGRKWADFRRDECGVVETTAVFPTAIAPKYAGEKDIDKARKMTCADQFTTNKATNANGGLKWIERDGGYYGECISRLRG